MAILSQRDHQTNLAPSWLMRAALVPKIRPKFGSATFLTGLPHWVWFQALKDSKRNWKLIFSVILKFLNKPVSQLFVPGSRRMPRPEVPRNPAAGCLNADVSNHWSMDLINLAFPTRSARFVPKVSFNPPTSDAAIVMGNP